MRAPTYDDTYSKSVNLEHPRQSYIVGIQDGQVAKVSDQTADERPGTATYLLLVSPGLVPISGKRVAGTGKAKGNLSDATDSCSSKVELPRVGQPAKPIIPNATHRF